MKIAGKGKAMKNEGFFETFRSDVIEGIEDRIGQIVEEEVAKAVEAVQLRIRSEVAKTAMHMASQYNIRDMGHSVIIEVFHYDKK